MNDKKEQTQVPAPNQTDGAVVTRPSAWKRLLGKKWVFPATYVAAAAIILTLMWVYQGTDDGTLSNEKLGTTQNEAAVPGNAIEVSAAAAAESFSWPVADRSALEVVMPFYDSNASNEQRQAALVQYGDTFTPHMGIGLAKQDNTTFDVLAAQKGKVTRVENHPVVGNVVEITHENGLVTIYESLSDVVVTKGEEVTKGFVIAKAGRNELEKDLGIHVHFEVQDNGTPVNPESLIKAK